MKNIIKTTFVMLTSLSLFASANAGELSVTGTAKATYNILSGDGQNAGKGIGVANEFKLGASGDIVDGYTWAYSIAMDPDNTSGGTTGEVQNDDSSLTVTTPYGTLAVMSKVGGLDVEDSASQSVYARPTDIGDPSATSDNYTIDSYNNLQYHTAAGLLPYDVVFKVAYATGLDATQNSSNAGGATSTASSTSMGSSATEYQISGKPIDTVTIGASYIEFDGAGLTGTNDKQQPESGAAYVKYKEDRLSVGVSRALKAPLISIAAVATAGTVEFYEQTNASIAYLVSDQLSISYEIEQSETNKVSATDVEVKQKSSAIQGAYTMGGMTLAVSYGHHRNNGYVEGADADQALFAVSMAF